MHQTTSENYVEHLTVKCTLYTLNTCFQDPKFCPFHSTICRFKIQSCWKSAKSEMHRMTSDLSWTCNNQNYSIYTKCLHSRPKMFVRFALRPAVFKIQGWWKSEISEMYRMSSDWLWSLNSQKYLMYTK